MRRVGSNIFEVAVPHRSGFDKSHYNCLTSYCGTITPILCDEIIPNSKIKLKLNLGGSMPPLATDCYMKVDLRVEAFFVPSRILYKGWEDWFSQQSTYVVRYDTNTGVSNVQASLPRLRVNWATCKTKWKSPCSLLDYFGLQNTSEPNTDSYFNIFPFLAYHMVWQEYYRQPSVQLPCFAPDDKAGQFNTLAQPFHVATRLPYMIVRANAEDCLTSDANSQEYLDLADGVNLLDTRQRNFGYDYFVNAFPTAQLGLAESVSTTGNTFTIASLRAANSLQQFKERNLIPGSRYTDQLKARYGADLSYGVAQRPIFLGSAVYDFYNKSMVVTANNEDTSGANPFSDVAGAVQGNAYTNGSDLLVDGFTANEHGWLLVNATLVPRVTYMNGLRRQMQKYVSGISSIVDMPNPILQNTGFQPIYKSELTGNPNDTGVFGYTDRYAEAMTIPDGVHGTFRTTLSSFLAYRYASGNPSISSAFLEIPVSYLDNVTCASSALSYYGYWLQCKFDYFVSMPLAEYCIPSLQDPAYEHGDFVKVHRGGFRF